MLKIKQFLFNLIAIIIIASGCGIPEFTSIDPPTVVDTDISETMVAFKTPSDDKNILGYMIYYKIYTDTGNYQADKTYFDSGDDSIKPGDTDLINKGFSRVGIRSNSGTELSSNAEGTIKEIGKDSDSEVIFINIDSNSSQEPKVGYLENYNSSNPLPKFETLQALDISLTRGYTDIRKDDSQLLSFVNDWSVGSTKEDYFDGDLRVPAPVRDQPGRSSNLNSWQQLDPLYTTASIPPELYIAFAVYTLGLEIGGGKLSFMYSQPLHLGRVSYSVIKNKVR